MIILKYFQNFILFPRKNTPFYYTKVWIIIEKAKKNSLILTP